MLNRFQIESKATQIDPKVITNRPEIDPKSTYNRPQIDPKSTYNGPQLEEKPNSSRPKVDLYQVLGSKHWVRGTWY